MNMEQQSRLIAILAEDERSIGCGVPVPNIPGIRCGEVLPEPDPYVWGAFNCDPVLCNSCNDIESILLLEKIFPNGDCE